ncbi:PIN domain-containing protein [Actinosynnema sp. NPDC059797]
MRDAFYGHYRLTDSELDRLWAEGIVILDTNALLNLYRYSPKAREEFFGALEQVKDRLWMPHRVGVEFHANRVERISEQLGVEDSIEKILDDITNSIKGKLGPLRRNAFISVEDLESKLTKAVGQARDELRAQREKRAQSYGITVRQDPIVERLAILYGNNVGSPYSDTEMQEIRSMADGRYDSNTPPGYMDRNKEGDRKYGDYLIWRQIIDYSKKGNSDVLFITDDAKEDWWWIVRNEAVGRQTLGPRPELREEFYKETQRLFYMYSPENFLEKLSSLTEGTLSSEVVDEVRETSKDVNERSDLSNDDVLERIINLEDAERDIQREIAITVNRIDQLTYKAAQNSNVFSDEEELVDEYDRSKALRDVLVTKLKSAHERLGAKREAGSASAVIADIRDLERRLKREEVRLLELSSEKKKAQRVGGAAELNTLVEIDEALREENARLIALQASQHKVRRTIDSFYRAD